MTLFIDVFNGDADGIFSLIQWRKAYPVSSSDEQVLITGVKRDISLVDTLSDDRAAHADITVLDISFDKNVQGVRRVLDNCQSLFYCDHHKADLLFEHPKLSTKINTKPTVCTGLLINGYLNRVLKGKARYPLWAIAAAFGDGLDNVANTYAATLGLSAEQRDAVKELGVLVNYNGYGSTVEDLHFSPDQLYRLLIEYDTPFEVITDSKSPYQQLKQGYEADIEQARRSQQLDRLGLVAVMLEDAAWARRISGTYGNQLASAYPDKPVVIVTHNTQGSYTVSLRAPKHNPYGASTICSQFETGGGREGAAGINQLPLSKLDSFLDTVYHYYYPA